ncbi:hypothetical protein F4782DRAFT_527158 [Xylaria castorea]|nr:hypothetical protein F4782DRAFT_527158 [Xylaria castorea]
MENNSMGSTDGSDGSNGDSNSPHKHPEERSRLLTDSLYDGPLNHIIRNHPKLFVRPRDWTKRHARFLHVVCKEERSWLLASTQHCQRTRQQDHESLVQHVEKPTSKSQELELEDTRYHTTSSSDTDTDVLRVPPFQFPSLPHPHLNSHVGRLRSESAFISYLSRQIALKSLLVWKRPRPSKIWRTLLNPDHVASEPIKTCGYKSDDNIKYARHKLKVEHSPLFIKYGKRKISIGLSPQTYTLAGDTSYTQRNAWRLIYLDRSQLGMGRPLSKRERRRLRMAARLGIDMKNGRDPSIVVSSDDDEDERDGWPVNEGYMASLFIAMAQERQCEAEYKKEQKTQPSAADTQIASHGSSHSTPQLHPRYQILLTNNDADSSCIHLYTAHVSDFLLEHFRNPARFPHIAPSEHESHLLKIHRTKIPFTPYKSFRRRLRMTIMEYANGTAGGFFSGLNLTHDGDQERSSECVLTTVKVDESASLKHPEEQVYTQVCVVA